MTRAYRFATFGVVIILAMVIHWFGTTLFAPGTELYQLGAVGVGTFINSGWRDTMYKIFAQFLPLLFVGFGFAWLFATEYEDAVNTGVRRY